MTDFALAPDRVRFRALARTFVPALARSPAETWDALESTMTVALASRPAAMIRQLRLFVRMLDWACWVRFGRSLDQADDARRLQLLQAFERAPVQLVRRGVWGLRTLVFMGYYTQATGHCRPWLPGLPWRMACPPMTARRYDVVIVGAGAGGGTMAARMVSLVAAGQSVLVLEQGPRFQTTTSPAASWTWPAPSSPTAAGSSPRTAA